jgi:2-dehydro-3-deoxyphosphooctonate aldolase (KDO 8-P synthase)
MLIISGPCVIESYDTIMNIAERLQKLQSNKDIDFYFKASFEKANRTSFNSFRGVGIEEGLRILEQVKNNFNYKITTDVHECNQVDEISQIVDMIQIPAFLCRQTNLIEKVANTTCEINIKKGQFLNPEDMKFVIQKILNIKKERIINYDTSLKHKIYSCERGSSFGYSDIIVDMRSLAIMKKNSPVIFDATHSVQTPGNNGKTGGKKEFIPLLAKCAASAGVDGFFFETHHDMKNALSDKDCMIEINTLYNVIDEILEISKVIRIQENNVKGNE